VDDANPTNRHVDFLPLWTVDTLPSQLGGVTTNWPIMAWKATTALLPLPGLFPRVVSAGGIGGGDDQTGAYGACPAGVVRGWVGALDPFSGAKHQSLAYDDEGNIRASPAVADLDGDGIPDVVVPFGCTGKVRCYSGQTFKELWSFQLGDPAQPWTQRSIGSPSIGDVNGDGLLDVIVSAFDGNLYCLSGYDFRVTSVTLDSLRHPTFTWKSFGGTRYRVQFRNGSPDGSFTDIVSSEQTDPHYPGRVGTLSFTDDFTQTGGPPPSGGRFYRIRMVLP